ncbi:MAG: sigma-70 family RNA polymerase sigma factor [Ferruginibacter sp.]
MNPGDYKHIDDQQLLAFFKKDRNNEWLGILLQRYTLMLLGVCMKYLKDEEAAKDSVQQIFMKVIDELHKYEVAYFKTWLYTLAKNHCLMQLRSKKSYFKELNDNTMSVTDDAEGMELAIQKENSLNLMELAMEELNEDQRKCLTLFFLEKKSYQDIVSSTNFSMHQVKSHIQNGKRNLKLQFQRLQNEQ